MNRNRPPSSRNRRSPRLIAETLESRRLFSAAAVDLSLASVITLQPAAVNANHLAIAPDGSLWYTATGSIERQTPAGQQTIFPLPTGESMISNLVISPDDSAWFVLSAGPTDLLEKLTPDGTFTPVAPLASEPTHFLAAGPNGVWFTDGPQTIGYITTGYSATGYSANANPQLTQLPGQNQITGLAADSQGNLWFTADAPQSAGILGKIDPAGHLQTRALPVAPDDPTLAADGSLFFTGGGAIWHMSPAGSLSQTPLPNISPAALAPAPDGSVWFFDAAQTTHPLWRLAQNGTLESFAITGSPPLTSLAIAPGGDLWFTASNAQSATLGHLSLATLPQGFTLTSASGLFTTTSTADVLSFNGSELSITGLGTLGTVNIGTISDAQDNTILTGGLITNSAGGTSIVFSSNSDAVTVTIQTAAIIQTLAQTLAPAGSPSDPALPATRPANNPAPETPDDPGSFDGEFTVQPAAPAAPLPPEEPRPPHEPDASESRANSSQPPLLATATPQNFPTARPSHTHVPTHRDTAVPAALFSLQSAPQLNAATAPLASPATASLSSIALQQSALLIEPPASFDPPATPSAADSPTSAPDSAAPRDPLTTLWKFTTYAAFAPTLFERRPAPLTRIHW